MGSPEAPIAANELNKSEHEVKKLKGPLMPLARLRIAWQTFANTREPIASEYVTMDRRWKEKSGWAHTTQPKAWALYQIAGEMRGCILESNREDLH